MTVADLSVNDEVEFYMFHNEGAAQSLPCEATPKHDAQMSVTQLSGDRGGVPEVSARATNSGNESISNNTLTALTFDTEQYDTDNIHSTSSNTSRLTANTAGKYLICANVTWTTNATGYRLLRIRLNGGSTYIASSVYTATGTPDFASTDNQACTIYNLAASDYVEAYVEQDSGGALNVTAQANYSPAFMMTKLDGGVADSLQSVYNSGNTITTLDARDIAFTLADTATDSNFTLDLAGAGDFLIKDAGTAFATFDDSGGITFAPNSTSDVTFTLDDDSTAILNGTITNTGSLQDINLTLGNDAGADTIAGLNIDVTSVDTGADSDVLDGILVGNLSGGNSNVTERAIDIGTGWDVALNAQSGNIITSNLGVEFTESDTNPSCSSGDYKVYADTSEGRLKKCQNGTATDLDTAQALAAAYKVKPSDESVTNDTNLQNDDDLSFSIGANETWSVIWHLQVNNGSSATPDFKAAVKGPASSTCQFIADGEEPSDAEFPQATATDCTTPGTLVNSVVASDAGTSYQVYIYGYISTGATPGTVNLQFAENTGGVGTSLTFKKGSFMTAYKQGGADLAETYYSNGKVLKPGTVVAQDSSLDSGVAESNNPYQSNLLGVITTKPGLVLGDDQAQSRGVPSPVALAGRVPVQVSTENGPIRPGDYLTSSSIPGVSMRASKAGRVIGQALSGYNGSGVGQAMVFINSGSWNGPKASDWLSTLPGPENGMTADPTDIGTDILAHLISHPELLMPDPSELSEITTDRLTAGLEVVTPKVTTDKIALNTISSSTESDIRMKLGEGGKFVIAGEDGNDAITFDAAGNAQFAGTITADKVKANQIEGLEILTGKISALGNMVEPSAGDATPQAGSTTDSDVVKFNKATFDSATIALDLKVNGDLLVGNGLTVNGVAEFNGDSIFDNLVTFNGKSLFNGDSEFAGRVTYNNDNGGFALIKQGENQLRVVFNHPFNEKPVVTVSVSDGQFVQYAYKDLTNDGFTIVLKDPAAQDINFAWSALSIKDAVTVGQGSSQ